MVLKQFEVEKSQFCRANCTFAPCPAGCAIQNCFGAIGGFPIAFNCVEGSFVESKLTWVYNYKYLIFGRFFRELAQEVIEMTKCFGTYE